MNWKHGYHADSGYTFGHYPETMPSRLRWASLLQGHTAAPGQFRYLDAGCGQGLNLIIAAACHPDSEFVGIDFLPEHIAHARGLAQTCGLGNVTFIEGDFVALTEQPDALGSFDYAVCHGISTWIAPAVKQALFKLVGRVLKPAGVFYNSYNTFPGWLAAVPFQHLVLLEQRSKPGTLALKTAQRHMERLQTSAPALFANLPGLKGRLEGMAKQDPAYLVQEYNNHFWQPVFVTQMIDDMATVKLEYLGTATLAEANEALLQPATRALLAEQSSPAVREQLRDYAVNQSFRRDLYVKGFSRPWRADSQRLKNELAVTVNPVTPRPAATASYPFKAGSLELQSDAKVYNSLMDVLTEHPEGLSVAALTDTQPSTQKGQVMQALSMLMHGGWVLPHLTSAGKAADARRANQALARAAVAGASYHYAVGPRVGMGVRLSDSDWCLLHTHFEKCPAAQRGAAILNGLASMGKALAQQGQPVTEPQQRDALVAAQIKRFDTVTLPWLKRLGAV